jgi:hypothetical protein
MERGSPSASAERPSAASARRWRRLALSVELFGFSVREAQSFVSIRVNSWLGEYNIETKQSHSRGLVYSWLNFVAFLRTISDNASGL